MAGAAFDTLHTARGLEARFCRALWMQAGAVTALAGIAPADAIIGAAG